MEFLFDNVDIHDIINEQYLIEESILRKIPEINKDIIECPICYDEIEKDRIVYLKKCKHKFCSSCIKIYIGRKSHKVPCPYCRIPFNKKDIQCPKIQRCRCGSLNHKKTNHSSCPLNKNN